MMKKIKYILLGMVFGCACMLCACDFSDASLPMLPPEQSESGAESGGSGNLGGTENGGENQESGGQGLGKEEDSSSSPDNSSGGFQGDAGTSDAYAPNF